MECHQVQAATITSRTHRIVKHIATVPTPAHAAADSQACHGQTSAALSAAHSLLPMRLNFAVTTKGCCCRWAGRAAACTRVPQRALLLLHRGKRGGGGQQGAGNQWWANSSSRQRNTRGRLPSLPVDSPRHARAALPAAMPCCRPAIAAARRPSGAASACGAWDGGPGDQPTAAPWASTHACGCQGAMPPPPPPWRAPERLHCFGPSLHHSAASRSLSTGPSSDCARMGGAGGADGAP